VMPGTGHLGQNVYQGVVKVWNGMHKMLEQLSFPHVYGGAGSSSKVQVY
jgi:hypothetical protein